MRKLCIRCFVAGKVQGVWFRGGAAEQAKQLGLTGFACNLPDGRVEVMACGEEEKLNQFKDWLKRGPKLAKVTEVSVEELPWQEQEDFAVR